MISVVLCNDLFDFFVTHKMVSVRARLFSG